MTQGLIVSSPRPAPPVPGLQAGGSPVYPYTVRGVLFDYGLTLVTFTFPREALLAAMEQVRGWLGPTSPRAEALLEYVLLPNEEALSKLDGSREEIDYLTFYDRAWRRAGFDLPRSTLYRILDLEQRCWDGAVRLAPDALQTLDELRRRGIRTAICSNAPFPPEMMRRQMQGVGVGERVDGIVLSSEVGRRKPDPAIYLAALARLDIAPPDALFVGDQVREDYEGPRLAGMEAVLCTALARRRPPPEVPTISRLSELQDHLR